MCEAQSVRVLVTGASSGIGEAFARWHAARGDALVITGRSAEQLQRVAVDLRSAGATVQIVIVDLATAAGVDSLVAQAGDIDVVVANAGITHAATVGTTDREELDRLSYLMSTGVVRLCESLVPAMLQRGRGEVVVVSSIAAFTPMRKAGPYAAAKSAVTAYARSLALEVGSKGVRVVAVCPGYVHTDLHRRAGLEHLTTNLPEWMWLEPDDVVRDTRRALARGKTVVVPGLVYRLVRPFLASSLTQGVWRRMTRR
ncbi:MAG: SDR family NAD(P)-dependent oxidoreductase [Actinobacteria bacterium]|nr:SDR family NAD(P)-dependent oxidoreductase [Actinomycetota bacterium]NDG76884.1 SDR family NAD(P)-dependent oxidoreductase [Acidimicrobiia bacterium]NBO33884.1 SDR family NAD(P)-dependent oxidoreductase [Actinomycetota bacterium]NBP17651.1 SDR family NAD(P)-dependent oxidoreductase [Actinomycetota bacterium]NCY08910.1 SDR family NAD(P)-dependent oxidoreductase [Actinomycetota bacterium]